MKRSKILLALVAVLLVSVVVISGCGQKSTLPPGELIKRAQSEVAKAKAAKLPDDKAQYYQNAINDYNEAIGKTRDPLQEVRARYDLGILYETAEGKSKNLKAANNEFSTIVSRYDKPEHELSQTIEKPNVEKILAIVKEAKARKNQTAAELDKQNSKNVLYKVMDFFVRLTGKHAAFSYWFAIILVTFIVKIIITPLTKAQFKAMKEMQKIAPLVKEIQEKHKGDQTTIGHKTMELYKEHGINPFASCLPLLIQMPILWILYYMIQLYQFQFVHGTFLWIGSALSHLASFTVPFGAGGLVWVTAANLSEPDVILVVLYVISMYISTKLSAVDPSQAEQQRMMAIVMPLMFAFIFAGFPSAFLLYWLVFNIIQTVQQYLILHGGPQPAGPSSTPPPPAPEEKPKDQPSDQTQRVRRRRRR